jgi:putative flavoprotein involved in K+ transport
MAGDRRFEAENVVVAMATYQVPWLPPFAQELDHGIVQLHSGRYRNPSQLQGGGVLVVGAGNSGVEIAVEVARSHPTWLSGKYPGHIPFRPDSVVGRRIGVRLVRFLGHHMLTVNTPLGRKVRPKLLHRAGPLVRVKPKDIAAAGIQRVPRVAGVRNGLPMLEDQQVLDVTNVIWCTGFRPDFSWINLPIFGEEEKEPEHRRGIIAREPGLYFVGLFFLYAATSGIFTGVGRDAKHVVKDIAARTRTARAAEKRPPSLLANRR